MFRYDERKKDSQPVAPKRALSQQPEEYSEFEPPPFKPPVPARGPGEATAPYSRLLEQLHAEPEGTLALAAPGSSTPEERAKTLHDALQKASRTVLDIDIGDGADVMANLNNGTSRYLSRHNRHLEIRGQDVASLRSLLELWRGRGHLEETLEAYERLYGKSFYAEIGERVREGKLRQELLALLPPPIPQEQLTFDAFLEHLAVNFVYSNEPDFAADDRTGLEPRRKSNPAELLKAFGYLSGRPIFGKWGFQMRVFLPDPQKKTPHNAHPVVAFRGTEGVGLRVRDDPKTPHNEQESGLDTLVADFAYAEVGYSQYRQNRDLIERNLEAAARRGRLILTGHSLGGALAQIAAVEHMALAKEIVTFQAAAIKQADVDRLKAYNARHATDGKAIASRHYRVDGDIVPTAGEASTPGEIHYFDYRREGQGLLGMLKENHVTPALSEYLRQELLAASRRSGGLELDPYQTALMRWGQRDEQDLAGKSVEIIYSGDYSTERDPKLRGEMLRRELLARVLDAAGLFEAVFYENLAYNVLLEAIEGLARKYDSYPRFEQEALKLLNKSEPLFPGPGTQEIARELGIAEEANPLLVSVKTRWGQIKEKGMMISQIVKDLIKFELKKIWTSWHPDKEWP
ncbi:MAG: hypothetical protein C4333_01530 [Meiothermus sp.]